MKLDHAPVAETKVDQEDHARIVLDRLVKNLRLELDRQNVGVLDVPEAFTREPFKGYIDNATSQLEEHNMTFDEVASIVTQYIERAILAPLACGIATGEVTCDDRRLNEQMHQGFGLSDIVLGEVLQDLMWRSGASGINTALIEQFGSERKVEVLSREQTGRSITVPQSMYIEVLTRNSCGSSSEPVRTNHKRLMGRATVASTLAVVAAMSAVPSPAYADTLPPTPPEPMKISVSSEAQPSTTPESIPPNAVVEAPAEVPTSEASQLTTSGTEPQDEVTTEVARDQQSGSDARVSGRPSPEQKSAPPSPEEVLRALVGDDSTQGQREGQLKITTPTTLDTQVKGSHLPDEDTPRVAVITAEVSSEPSLLETSDNLAGALVVVGKPQDIQAEDKAESSSLSLTEEQEHIIDTLDISGSNKKFLAELVKAASAIQASGDDINVRVLVAQAIHESGWGRSDLASKHNNLFGVKSGPWWKGEEVLMRTLEYDSDGNPYREISRWRAYPTYAASIKDYARLLREKPHFADALKFPDDDSKYLDGLLGKIDAHGRVIIPQGQRGASSYATDPKYKRKILSTIDTLRLNVLLPATSNTHTASEIASLASNIVVGIPIPDDRGESTEPTVSAERKSSEGIEGAEYIGGFKGRHGETIELYAIDDLPSRSQESTPGTKYYVKGANGRALVRKEIAADVVAMVAAAKKDGVDLQLLSSFRTYRHQEDLCQGNARCRRGDHKFVAAPGHSNHNGGEALDFDIIGGNSGNCTWVSEICTAPDDEKYKWLKKNASRFGLQQYRNEAWHFDRRKH